MTSLDRFRIATSRGGTNELRCDQHPDELLATWDSTMGLVELLRLVFAHNLEHHPDADEQWYLPVPAAVAEVFNATGMRPLDEAHGRRPEQKD